MKINIKNISKAKILSALYNSSKPQGLGFLHFKPEDMDEVTAQKMIDDYGLNFDYLKGRVMKVNLANDELDLYLYDRDNGVGAREQSLRRAGLI